MDGGFDRLVHLSQDSAHQGEIAFKIRNGRLVHVKVRHCILILAPELRMLCSAELSCKRGPQLVNDAVNDMALILR